MTESTCDLLSLVVAGGMVSAGYDDSSLLDAPGGARRPLRPSSLKSDGRRPSPVRPVHRRPNETVRRRPSARQTSLTATSPPGLATVARSPA